MAITPLVEIQLWHTAEACLNLKIVIDERAPAWEGDVALALVEAEAVAIIVVGWTGAEAGGAAGLHAADVEVGGDCGGEVKG